MKPDLEGTRLGTGSMSAITLGAIGLTIPFSPTGVLEGEPALFIPARWQARIVSVGRTRLPAPIELPAHEFSGPAGKPLSGCLLHVPPGGGVVLGRSPQPRGDQEIDEKQIGVEMLKVGAAADKISSAMVSFVRVRKDEREGVFAVNGHYRKGQARNTPKLYPFIGETSAGVKQLNGPGTNHELTPGTEIYFGYHLEGTPEPRTYADVGEKLVFTTGLVDANPALSLSDLSASVKLGERTLCFALKKDVLAAVMVSFPDDELPVLGKLEVSGVPSLALNLRRAASRISRSGCVDILVGSNLGAMQAAAGARQQVAEYVILDAPGLAPAHAWFRLRADGEMLVVPIDASSIESTDARGTAHVIVREEFVLDATVLKLGEALTTKFFNKKANAPPPAPAPRRPADPLSATLSTTIGPGASGVRAPMAPQPPPRGLLSRILGLFGMR